MAPLSVSCLALDIKDVGPTGSVSTSRLWAKRFGRAAGFRPSALLSFRDELTSAAPSGECSLACCHRLVDVRPAPGAPDEALATCPVSLRAEKKGGHTELEKGSVHSAATGQDKVWEAPKPTCFCSSERVTRTWSRASGSTRGRRSKPHCACVPSVSLSFSLPL